MTLSNIPSREIKPGNDVATIFSFGFIINKADDLKVVLKDSLGVETELSEGVGTNDYIVNVTTFPGSGSITYPASGTGVLPTGSTLTLYRDVDLDQDTDLQNQGPYKPEQVESTFDYSRMVDQQQQDQLDRSIKTSVTDDSGADFTLPDPTPNAVIGIWNGTGDAIIEGPSADEISNAQGYAQAASDSADAAEAAKDAAEIARDEAVAAAAAGPYTRVLTLDAGTHDLELPDSPTYYILNTSSGTITINLPLITDRDGATFGFQRSGSNTATMVPDGTDTINGVAGNYIMNNDTEVVQFISDNRDPSVDNWIANIQSQTFAGAGLDKTGSTLFVPTGGITGDMIDPDVELGGPSLGSRSVIRYNAPSIQEDITLWEDRIASITVNNATEIINIGTDDNYNDGDILQFTADTIPTGLSLGQNYYVINATATTCQVSLTRGGSVEAFTDDGVNVGVYKPVSGRTNPDVTIEDGFTVAISDGSTWSV